MKTQLLTVMFTALYFCAAAQANQSSTVNPSPMKQFSVLVRVPNSYTTEQAKQVNPQWEKALQEWKADNAYVLSFAFPGESFTISGTDKIVKKESVLAGNQRVVSNIVLQAESITKALELAKKCPVLSYGGLVEVREIPTGVSFSN